MARLTAKDFPPELLELYDGYVHGRISRRQFLDRAGALAIGGMSAVAILAAMNAEDRKALAPILRRKGDGRRAVAGKDE